MSAARTLAAPLHHLARTLAAGDLAGLPDTELVGRFAARRDEAAFAALVRRHGALVLGVCRRVLRHEQDAEDAFQAAFLVLARNAASLRRTAAVSSWLYGVAVNVARKAKALRLRRQAKEREAAARRPVATEPTPADDLSEILDDALQALPEKYRSPLVLCDLRGLTVREAAAAVGCPLKTMETRLARGRALLARRLTRRGVTLSVAALAALTAAPAAADVARLTAATVPRALGAAVPPALLPLIQGVTPAMMSKSLKYAAALLVALLLFSGIAAGSRPAPAPAAPAAAPAEPKRERMFDPHEFHRQLHRFFMALLGPIHLGFADADDKDAKDKTALAGIWERKGGEQKIEFVDKETMKISAHKGDLVVVCKYTVEKGDKVKAKITGLEGKEELKDKAKDKLPVDLEFTFVWKPKDGKAMLDDLKGENTEILKTHVEGDYEEKK